jgi:hypothetical protein
MSGGRRVIVGLLASLVAMTGLVVAGASPASAAGCYNIRQSTVYLNGKSNEYEYATHYSQSGQVTVGERRFYRKDVKSGYVAVTFLACKRTQTAPWTALTYSTSTNLKDLKLIITGKKVNPVPANGKRGFGLLVQRVTKANTVQVQPLVCTKKAGRLTALGAAKFVTGLPIPVSPAKAVGLWVVNNGLKEEDDKFQCGLMGAVTDVPFTFTAGGEVKLRMPSTNKYVFSRRATWTDTCSTDPYCGITHDQVLELRSGKS